MSSEEIMARMTDEEADYWDDYFTKNPPIRPLIIGELVREKITAAM
jgi:hypothetical protein